MATKINTVRLQPFARWFGLLILLAGTLLLPNVGLAAQTPKTATKLTLKALQTKPSVYNLLEMNIETDGVVANPFDPAQFDLRVRFTSATSQTLLASAFWYQAFDPATLQPQGAPVWRVRFTPPSAGQWRAQAQLSRPKLTSQPITFTVDPADDGRGFVRINAQDPHYFAFDNGDFYFPIGLNIAWSNQQGVGVLQDYERWLDRFSQNGGNLARIWMAAWSFGLEWNDTGLGNYSKRQKQAWLLDQVFKLAEERNVTIMLTLINHGQFNKTVNPEWDQNPYNVANGGMLKTPEEFVTNPQAKQLFKQRLRYIAARYSYSTSLFAWEWWNEVNWTPINDTLLGPWMAEMSKELQQWDPYAHLITNSYANGRPSKLWRMPELSFAQQHDYTGRDPLLELPESFAAIQANAPAKPILQAEQGFSAAGADGELVFELVHLHNGIWAAPFTGYAGSSMYWWWDTLIDPLDLWSEFKAIDTFMQGEELSAMRVTTGTISPAGAQALALQTDNRALVWIRSDSYGVAAIQLAYERAVKNAIKTKTPLKEWRYVPPPLEKLTLILADLADGTYTAHWYLPATATWGEEVPVQVKDGMATLHVPTLQQDLALKIVQE